MTPEDRQPGMPEFMVLCMWVDSCATKHAVRELTTVPGDISRLFEDLGPSDCHDCPYIEPCKYLWDKIHDRMFDISTTPSRSSVMESAGSKKHDPRQGYSTTALEQILRHNPPGQGINDGG